MRRRAFTTGLGAALGLSGCAIGASRSAIPAARRALAGAAVYVPGYRPAAAGYPSGSDSGSDGPMRLLTRIGFDGDIRQALLPVGAHDVKISPDRRIGVLCGFEHADQVAFDPGSLELVARAPAFAPGWRGGGHAVFVDGGRTVVVSERAPRRHAGTRDLARQHGRVTIRDSATLRILDSHSTHGIDPHDIRLTGDGRHLAIAHYGSLPAPGQTRLGAPRRVAEASITIIDLASGALVAKWVTDRADTELRHLAAAPGNRVWGIQARLAMRPPETAPESGPDPTTPAGQTYLPAPPLRVALGDEAALAMGRAGDRARMRQGLSIVHDPAHGQVIATFASSHRVLVFDDASGRVAARTDTAAQGLRHPAGVTLLPDGRHYAVTGYWENLFVYERGRHRLVPDLSLAATFFGHSHITAA